MQPRGPQSLALPIAIVIGFSIIAVAIFLSNNNSTPTTTTQSATAITPPTPEELATRLHEPIARITAADHIRGNPNAPIMFVVYTSFECPSCRSYHLSLQRLLQEYGPTGQVAWTFRHLPLEENYLNAPLIAHAAECVAQEGGNTAFWNYADAVFQARGVIEQTDLNQLPALASTHGVSVDAFNACMQQQKFANHIRQNSEDAFRAGAIGIPYTVVFAGEEVGVINGPQPYNELRQVVEVALRTLPNAQQ